MLALVDFTGGPDPLLLPVRSLPADTRPVERLVTVHDVPAPVQVAGALVVVAGTAPCLDALEALSGAAALVVTGDRARAERIAASTGIPVLVSTSAGANAANTDRDLLIARARITAARTESGPVTDEDSALRALLADLALADLLSDLAEYGLAAADAALIAAHGHDATPRWPDRPFPGTDPDTVIARLIDPADRTGPATP